MKDLDSIENATIVLKVLSIHDSVSANSRPYIETAEDPVEVWTTLRQRSSQVGASMQGTALSIDFRHTKPAPGFPIADCSDLRC